MTALAEPVAARWLTDTLPPCVDPAWDAPTIVRGVWIDYENWAPDVYSLRGPVAHGPLTRDTRGRYRVTCDDGVRRRLTIQQLRGEA